MTFHRYMLRTAQQKATEALGAPVQLREYTLHFSGIGPTLDLYNVRVDGAAPYSYPPLLQVDHVNVAVRVVSLLHRTWYLGNIAVDHPVMHVFEDKDGRDNLPQTKSSGQSHTSVFDLAIQHAMLDRGEIYYNNRKSVLSADLHELTFQSAFDNGQRRYAGNMSYRNGHLQFGNYMPMEHDLDAQFEATPATFKLHNAVLKSGPSQFALDATVENYANPQVQATYNAMVDAAQFRRILKNPSLPTGVLRAAGSLKYAAEPNRPALETVTLNGDLSSRMLQIQTPTMRSELRDLSAQYSVNNNNLEVRNLRARLLGGEFNGLLSMRNLSGPSQSSLKATLHGVSLADLKAMLASPALKQVSLTGVANADADAKWGPTMNNLVAHSNVTLQGKAGKAGAGAAAALPLNGVVHATYAGASKEITLSQSYLRTPQSSVNLNGAVGDHSALQVRLQSNDLHEFETLADLLRTPQPGQKPLGLYGTANFNGAVRGSTANPQLTGQLLASNLRLQGSAWRMLRTNLAASPSLVHLQNGELDPAQRGRITFDLQAGLHKWAFTQNSPIAVALNASQLDVASLAKAAGSQAPVTGTLSANIAVHGSELSPVGQGKISLSNATISSERVQSLNVDFQGTGDAVHANLALRMPAGASNGTLTYFPRQQGYEVHLQANGIQLAQLETVKQRNLQLAGVLNALVDGRGTFKDPQLNATIQAPKLDVQKQTISGLKLQANVANHKAEIALDSEVINTAIRGRGTVDLNGDYYTTAALDTQNIPLQPLVAAYAPAQAGNVTGQTELHATLRGPLKDKTRVEAHVTVPTLQVNYKNAVQLGATAPIHVDYVNGTIALQRTTIRGTDTDLQLQGDVPLNSTAPAQLLALGTIDLRLAQLLDPQIVSSGQLRFNINSYGRAANANVQGQVAIVNANFATGDLPIGLQNGNGVLLLTKDRLQVKQFNGVVGGGTVTAQGAVVYRPSMQFDLALRGEGVRLLYPDGVRSASDANLALTGTLQAAMLRGEIDIQQLSFTPDFDLNSFIGQFSGSSATPPPAQGFSQNLQVDIAVRSANQINLVSQTLSLQGAANLNVRGTAGDPVVLGRVNLSGGDLIYMGNRYILQSGTLDFINPYEIQPVVNVAVNTTIEQYNINMHFQGPADRLRTDYTSDPALPQSDIINLLAFGKTTEEAAANPTPGNSGAESLIASQVSSQVTSRVEKIAGISHLSVDPALGSNQQNPGARVTIQQRVTSKIFVTFSTDVTSTQSQVIQLEYQASPRVSYSAVRDQNGGFAFDTRIHKTW